GVVATSAPLAALAARVCVRAGLEVAPGYPVAAADLADAARAAVVDGAADAVLVVVPPPDGPTDAPVAPSSGGARSPFEAASWLAAGPVEADKPVVAVLLGQDPPAGGAVPAYRTVEEAARALSRVAAYAAWRREPAGEIVPLSDVDTAGGRAVADAGGPAWDLLGAHGVRVVGEVAAHTAEQAVAVAAACGGPVALKATAPGLRHRLDLGAVRLDLADAAAVRRAYDEVSRAFGPHVVVQPMTAPGVACTVEVVDDPAFGPIVGFGLGGEATDLLGDRAWRAAPLTDTDAAQLVRAPRAAPLLLGHRGADPVDIDALVELLLRVGRLADEQAGVRRLLLNPVLAQATGCTVLHAEVSYGPPAFRPDTGPRRLP
ncbi:acetate--CoA ligase family protein, partial [Luedemannella flava]|uniref:acetate--CoA ligase family protein n=1 Tax=Luedemannella flava TaxID=349316 RepID=UPI0031DE0E57